MAYDGPESKFALFSNCNKSKIDGKEGEFWAKAEWPIEQIQKLHEWAATQAEQVENQRGEMCVVVAQKLLPRTSKNGNDYLLSVIKDPAPAQEQQQSSGGTSLF